MIKLPPSIIAFEEHDYVRVVRLKGAMDHDTADTIETFRRQLIGQKDFVYKNLLVDLAQVTDMDSASVALAVEAIKDLKTNKQKLGIFNAKPAHLSIFQILKVAPWITFYKNEAEAMEVLSKRGGA